MKTTIWKGAADRSLPTVYIHSVAGDGHNVWNRCREMGCPEFNLVSIHDFDFEGELTPWLAPGVRKGLPMFKGNAEAHLEKLLNEIMPEVEKACHINLPSMQLQDIHWQGSSHSGANGKQTYSTESDAVPPHSGTLDSLTL